MKKRIKSPLAPNSQMQLKNQTVNITDKGKLSMHIQDENDFTKLVMLLHLKVSMILLEQVEVMEAFLPYAYDQQSNQTLFEKAKDSKFKLLGN